MKLLEKEKNIETLFNFFDEHENDIVKVVYKDKTINRATLDTMYEDDEEECNVIVLKDLDTGYLFEISYNNVPQEIIYNGSNIIE